MSPKVSCETPSSSSCGLFRSSSFATGIPRPTACLVFASGVFTAWFCQAAMVNRYAHRDGGVQIDAQDLGHRAELLFYFRSNPDGVPEAAPLLIQISILPVLGSARLLRSTYVAIYGDRSLRRRDLDVHLTSRRWRNGKRGAVAAFERLVTPASRPKRTSNGRQQ